MTSTKKVGVSDIAKHAGVSIGTVSNYLNYPERVSETLKTKIRQSIATLGYEPRHPAPHLKAQSTAKPLVGYVMTDIEHPLFTRVFEGIQEVCEENDMIVLGGNALSDSNRQTDLINSFLEIGTTGLLVSTVNDSSEDVATIKASGKPVILIDSSGPLNENSICCVKENNVLAGQLAAEHLLGLNCSHIVFAAHSFEYESIQERESGIRRAIERSETPCQLSVIDTGGLMLEDGYYAAKSLLNLDSDDHPDGIIAGTDTLAAGILNGILESTALRVPQDICVIGCEGANIEPVCRMPLSVVAAPGNDMGRVAMSQLLDEIENPSIHVHTTTLLNPSLIVRASTER